MRARIASAIFLVLMVTTAADAYSCRTFQGDRHLYWSWREVDGRKCWYAGPKGVNKTALHWTTRIEHQARRRHGPHQQPTLLKDDDPEIWPRQERGWTHQE